MSPSDANDAHTPPVVGWASTTMVASSASRISSKATTVFAICMRAMTPSCMRAPPEAVTTTNGTPRSTHRSAARASFSPTTAPMLPPRNGKSMAATTHGRPRMMTSPTTRASVLPLASARSTRSG